MDKTQGAAFINSQVACAMAEIEAMKAANQERISKGYSLAYGEDAFLEIPDKYGLGHNVVITFLANCG